jgi:hypothetical protein
MEQIAKQLTDKWKEIIESISVRGYTRRIGSVNFFKMDNHYPGYPDVLCYKVNFNFEDNTIGSNHQSIYSNTTNPYIDDSKEKWNKELKDIFTNMFWNRVYYQSSDEVMPRAGSNSGETIFANNKVDYMTNQGYRFIIQFYPLGFLPELREEKLNELGII